MIIKEKEKTFLVLSSYHFKNDNDFIYVVKIVDVYGKIKNVSVSKDVYDLLLPGKKIIIKEIYELED